MKKRTSVSICIPAYNEEKNIAAILKSLLVQKTTRITIHKIVVVSSASTDKTDQIVAEYTQKDPRILLVQQQNREGKAAAINAFLQIVDDPLVVIQSADTIAAVDTIENLCIPLLDNPKIGMTGGAPIPVNNPNTFLGYIIHAWWWFHRMIPRFGEIIAYRNLLKEISPTTAVDEAYIQAKLIQMGYSVVHVDNAVVYNKGPENVGDLIKQRRRVFNGHARLHQEENVRIDNMTKSSLHLLLFKYKIKNIKQLIWFMGGVGIEVYARILGFYDMKYKNKNPFIWDIAKSTKNIIARRINKQRVVFLNFAPIEFMGGAEKWMNETARKLSAYEESVILSAAPSIANIYGKMVLKRTFKKRVEKDKLHKHMYLSLKAFIPFTKEWRTVRNYFQTSRLIYTKYELMELFIVLYFGGFPVLKKTFAGLHSPLIYFNPNGFWDHMHNIVYKSPASKKVLSVVKKVHVLNRKTETILASDFQLKNITYMPNGITPISAAVESSKTHTNILKVLFVGELSERKGVDILIQIMKNANENFEFSIAGDGYMRDQVLQAMSAMNHCNYYGFLREDKLAKLYEEHDVLILPSRAESMPLTVLEAMSYGLLIVDSEDVALGLDKTIEYSCDNNNITTYYYALSYLLNQKREHKIDKSHIQRYFHNNFSSKVIDPQVFRNVFEVSV